MLAWGVLTFSRRTSATRLYRDYFSNTTVENPGSVWNPWAVETWNNGFPGFVGMTDKVSFCLTCSSWNQYTGRALKLWPITPNQHSPPMAKSSSEQPWEVLANSCQEVKWASTPILNLTNSIFRINGLEVTSTTRSLHMYQWHPACCSIYWSKCDASQLPLTTHTFLPLY